MIRELAGATMNRADRRRQARLDEKLIAKGIDPERSIDSGDEVEAMARQLSSLLETAKIRKNIDPAIEFLNAKMNATLNGMRDVEIACAKGCSHCCNIWVSATAPEVLFIAKQIRKRVGFDQRRGAIKIAHEATKGFSHDIRDQHPYPCPMLVDDICSIYDIRPKVCRFAASGDAAVCARSYSNQTDESIPTPFPYFLSGGSYAIALGAALRQAELPYRAYEFNGALQRAIERSDAEPAWLAGEDVFAGVMTEPSDLFATPPGLALYKRAFGL